MFRIRRTAARELKGDPVALSQHHGELAQQLERLLELARADDQLAVRSVWPTLVSELQMHLEFEETHLFPTFGLRFPIEEAELRREHMEIRFAMGEVEREVDLGQAREESIEVLTAMVHDHARREERLLYPQSPDSERGRGPSFSERLAKWPGKLTSAA